MKSDAVNRRVFAVGFPGLYGGAATELHDQILVWLHLGKEVHLIPISSTYHSEPLYSEMVALRVIVHSSCLWTAIQPGDPVFGFCNPFFLTWLPQIRQRTRRTVFVNCMTWLLEDEKKRMAEGMIAMFLYQSPRVLAEIEPELRAINPDPGVNYIRFKPYFNAGRFPYHFEREDSHFGCGRISRQDADKFSAKTLQIYEYFVAPRIKSAIFLGFDARSEAKIGKPFPWIRTARDHREMLQSDFYRHCEIILQPSDTTENWPRIGLEAMASGSVLIVDNRGGWQDMVEHGKTGWLCDHERDFIYYASKMAYEPELRVDMALAAREKGRSLASLDESAATWEEVFRVLDTLPE